MKKVGILMGSKSDYDVVKQAIDVLKEFGVETEVRIISAHRTRTPRRSFGGENDASDYRIADTDVYDGRS